MYSINEIAGRLKTQDNRATDVPIFAVQQRRRIYGLDPDYCEQTAWIQEDEYCEVTDPEEIAELERKDHAGEDTENYRRAGYHDEWEFVQPFFTEAAAQCYIEENRHNLKDPRVYAYGSYRNHEWRAVRTDLMSESRGHPAAVEKLRGHVKILREVASALRHGNPHFLRAGQLEAIADSLSTGAAL